MRLPERTIAIFLSVEGREALQLAALGLGHLPALWAYVRDTDDIGLWVRIDRADGEHVLLIRWEYVVSIDFPTGDRQEVGLRV